MCHFFPHHPLSQPSSKLLCSLKRYPVEQKLFSFLFKAKYTSLSLSNLFTEKKERENLGKTKLKISCSLFVSSFKPCFYPRFASGFFKRDLVLPGDPKEKVSPQSIAFFVLCRLIVLFPETQYKRKKFENPSFSLFLFHFNTLLL
jgi:hypothetical protein